MTLLSHVIFSLVLITLLCVHLLLSVYYALVRVI